MSEQPLPLDETKQWKADDGQETLDDPLLNCLTLLSKLLNKPL